MPSFFSTLVSDAKKLINDPKVKEFTETAKQAADFAKKQATDLARAAKLKTEETLKDLAPKTPKEMLLEQLQEQIEGLEQLIQHETHRKTEKNNHIRATIEDVKISMALNNAPDLIKVFKLCIHALSSEISVDVLKTQEQEHHNILKNYICSSKHSLIDDATQTIFGESKKSTTGLDLLTQSIKISEELSVKTAHGKKQAKKLLASPHSDESEASNLSPRSP